MTTTTTMTRRTGITTDLWLHALRLLLTLTFLVAGIALTAYGAAQFHAAPLDAPKSGVYLGTGLWLLLTVGCMETIVRKAGLPF